MNSMKFAGIDALIRQAANWTAKPKHAYQTVWIDLLIHRYWLLSGSLNLYQRVPSEYHIHV